jgi:hypothetical protein
MRSLLALALLLGVLSVAFADTVTTLVYFNVPSSLTFTVTLPGDLESSGGASAAIEFNSSLPNAKMINCTSFVAGGLNQTDLIPCFNYSNTGNRDINFTMQFGAGVPAQVKVKAGQNNSAWIAACTCTSLIAGDCPRNDCVEVNSTVVKVANVSYGGFKEVWLWADFTNYMGGSSANSTLTHTSEAS